MTQDVDYDAVLYDAFPLDFHGVLRVWGRVKEDRKQRFHDGEGIYTSKVLSHADGLLRTKNSIYNVIWSDAECLAKLQAALAEEVTA
jgi:hypothetical protein